jgi:hypothetical protein
MGAYSLLGRGLDVRAAAKFGTALRAALFAFVLLAFTPPAMAITISEDQSTVMISAADVGKMFDVTYTCSIDEQCPDKPDELPDGVNTSGFTIEGQIWYEIVSYDLNDSNTVVFDITFSNKTTVGELSTLSSFGFNTDGTIDTSLTNPVEVTENFNNLMNPADWVAATGVNLPGIDNDIQACVFDVDGSCPSAGEGLDTGETDKIELTIAFTDLADGSTLTLSDFGVKFFGIGEGGLSLEFLSDTIVITFDDVPGEKVPEPSTVLLFITGLLGVGLLTRFRRRLYNRPVRPLPSLV